MGIVVGWWLRGRRIARPGGKDDRRERHKKDEHVGAVHAAKGRQFTYRSVDIFSMKNPLPSDQVLKASAAFFNREAVRLSKQDDPVGRTALVERIARLIRAAAELKALGL